MKEVLKGFHKLKGYFVIAVMCHEPAPSGFHVS